MIDLQRLFDDYSVHYDFSGKGWINVQCPHCNDNGTHGGLNPHFEVFNCWKCGSHNFEYSLLLILGIPKYSLSDVLSHYKTRRVQPVDLPTEAPRIAQVALPGESLKKIHRRYLRGRGFNPREIEDKYKLLGTGPIGKYRYRIIIPIFYHGKVVSFQGRSIIEEAKVRYLTAEDSESVIPAKETLFNIDSCIYSEAVICEGPFDVIRLGDGVVGVLGIQMTKQQQELLYTRFKKVTFLFDPEYEAQKRAEKYGSNLASLGMDVEIADLELDHDPGDLTEEEVQYVRKELITQ